MFSKSKQTHNNLGISIFRTEKTIRGAKFTVYQIKKNNLLKKNTLYDVLLT